MLLAVKLQVVALVLLALLVEALAAGCLTKKAGRSEIGCPRGQQLEWSCR
ncbi:MAG: hypothetical protein ACJAS7_000868 [Alpinimonas sp.]